MPLHRSIANGEWSNPAIWDTGIVPQLTGDTVEIHHRVLYDLDPAIAASISFPWIKIIGSAQQAELYAYDGSLGTPVNYVLRVTGSPDDAGIQVIYVDGMLPPKLTIKNNTPGNAGRNCIFDLKHVGNTADKFMDIDSRCDVQLQGILVPDNAEVFSYSTNFIRVIGKLTGKWKIGDTLYYYHGNDYTQRTIYSRVITNVAAASNLPDGTSTTNIRVSPPLPIPVEGSEIAKGNIIVVMAKSVRISNTVAGQCGVITVINNSLSGPSIFQDVRMDNITLSIEDRGIQFINVTMSKAVDFKAANFSWNGGSVYNSTFSQMVNCWLTDINMFGKSTDSVFSDCVGLELSGRIFCNYNVFTGSDHLVLTADMMFNYCILNECYYVDVRSAYIYGNEIGFLEPAHLIIYDSVFGYNRQGAIVANLKDIMGDFVAEVILKNVKPPEGGWEIVLGTAVHSFGKIGFEDEDGAHGQQRTMLLEGLIVKTPALNAESLIRRGGGATSAWVLPNSFCSRQRPLTVFEYFVEAKAGIERQFACYVVAGENWPTSLRGANASDPTALTEDSTLWLEAEYYNDEGLLTHSRKYSVEQVINSAAIDNYWTGTPLVVTVTPRRDGVVRIALKLATHSSGCFIVVDPRIIIS